MYRVADLFSMCDFQAGVHMMTVKEFLNDVRRQHVRVEACKERLKEIECEVISLKSPQLGDKIQSNNVKSLDEVICRLEIEKSRNIT